MFRSAPPTISERVSGGVNGRLLEVALRPHPDFGSPHEHEAYGYWHLSLGQTHGRAESYAQVLDHAIVLAARALDGES